MKATPHHKKDKILEKYIKKNHTMTAQLSYILDRISKYAGLIAAFFSCTSFSSGSL